MLHNRFVASKDQRENVQIQSFFLNTITLEKTARRIQERTKQKKWQLMVQHTERRQKKKRKTL